MILLDSPLEFGPVSLYRDHIEPATFHYLPGRPRLVETTGIGLLIYRGAAAEDPVRGGLLTLDVDLAHRPSDLAAAAAGLAQRFGLTPNLVPVLFDTGVVRLTTLGTSSPQPPEGAPSPEPVEGPSDPPPPESHPSSPEPVEGPPSPEPHPSSPEPVEGPTSPEPNLSSPEPVEGPTSPDPKPPSPEPTLSSAEPVEGPALVEQIIGTATPSLLGHGRAIFSLRLDAEGAVAVREALLAGTLPAILAYELAFRGVRPANGLRAALDYAMAYDYLRTRAAAATLWFKADLDRESESLERAGHIKITDVDYTGSDPNVLAARREAALEMIHELIETVFFRPAASPATLGPTAPPGVAAAWGAGGRSSAAFVLRGLTQDEEQQATYERSEMTVATVRVGPQGMITIPEGVDRASVIREVDLDEQSPRQLRVAAVDGPDWTGVDALQVDLRSSDQVRTIVLTAAAPSASVVAPSGPTDVRLTVFATPAADDLGTPTVATPDFVPLTVDTLLLDPAAVAGRTVLTVGLGAVPADLVTATSVRISTDAASTEHVLRHDQPSVAVAVWGHPPVTVDATLATTAGVVTFTQTVPGGESTVLVNLPRDRFRTVTVIGHDPLGRYQSIDVELEARPGAPRTRVTLDATTPSAYWTRVAETDDPGSYRVRVTRLGRDGVARAGDWTEAADSLLLVGDRDVRVDELTVVLAGWTDVVGALLSLTSRTPPAGVNGTVEVLVSDAAAPVIVSLPSRSNAPLAYDVTGQIFRSDEVVTVSLTGQSAEVLVLSPP